MKDAKAAELNIRDIADCIKIIDICAKRGAFDGMEMESVGKVRNRLEVFTEAYTQANQEKTDEQPDEGK